MSESLFRDDAHRRAGLWIITANWFIYSGQACVLPHLTRYYELDLGLNDTQIGILMVIPAIITMILQPVWGYIADSLLGRTQTFRLVAMLACVFLLLFSAAHLAGAFPILLLSAIGVVTMYRGSAPLLTSLTLSFLGEGRRHMFGRIRVHGSLSFALCIAILCPAAAMLGTWLELFPRTPVFLLGSLFFLLGLVCTQWDEKEFQKHSKPTRLAFQRLFQNTNLLHVYASLFLVGMGASVGFMYIGPFVEYKGQSDFFFGLLWFGGVITEVVLSIWLHKWIRPFGLKRFLVLAFFLEGMRWVGMAFASSPILYLLLFLLHGPSVVGIFFVTAMYLDHESDESVRSTAQTMLGVSIMGGHIAGYALGSQAVNALTTLGELNRVDAIQYAFLIFGCVALFSSLYCFLLVRTENGESGDKQPESL